MDGCQLDVQTAKGMHGILQSFLTHPEYNRGIHFVWGNFMHVVSRFTNALIISAIATLAGCSGAPAPSLAPDALPAATRDAMTGGANIFLSGSLPNAVYVLNPKGAIVATVTQGLNDPQGLATDRAGNLYVANIAANNILEFTPPYTGAPTVISGEAGGSPLDVAVDASGNLAVTNIATKKRSDRGNVAFYAAGATNATAILKSSQFQQPQYCAFDKDGNLFFDNVNDLAPNDNGRELTIGEVAGGIHGKSITNLTMSNKIPNESAGSIQVTNDGKIAVDDYVTPGGQGGNIYTYNAPKNGRLGTPVVLHLSGSDQPTTFAFLPGSKRLITSDYSLDATQTYTYPAGSLLNTVDLPENQLLQGVAV
jgi:hypothetical protein